MKFKLIEDYNDYSYISNGIEVVSDASESYAKIYLRGKDTLLLDNKQK